jgi:NDP-sugar pyrophosphorylase family protein
MLEVAGKPILEHIIRRASAQGIFNFVITLNYLGDVIETHFKDGERYGVSISYVRENEPLGTAGALSLIRDSFHEPVIVTNGDVLTEFSYTSILDFHINNNAEATMAIREYEWQNPFGVVKLTGVDIVDYEEKPVTKTQINAGVYVIEPSSLKEIPYASYCDMPTLFSMIRDTGKRVIAFPVHESWLDIGRPVDLHAANSRLGQQID